MNTIRPYSEAESIAEFGDALRAAGPRLESAPVMSAADRGVMQQEVAVAKAVVERNTAVRLDPLRVAIEAGLRSSPPRPLKPHYPAPTATVKEAMAAQRHAIQSCLTDAAKHVAIKKDLQKRRAKLDIQVPPKSPGRRAALRAMCTEMMAVHGPTWEAPSRRLLLPGAAGGGKTTVAASEIARLAAGLGRLNFYTTTLDNAEAVASKIPDAVVARGRSADDPKSHNSSRMCLRHETADAVAHAGLPVGKTLCRDADGRTCPLHDKCGYQRDAEAMRSGEACITVGSHEYLTLAGGMPTPDIVVIDESCLPPLIGHVEFGLDRLLPVEMPEWQAIGSDKATAYRQVMVRVQKAIKDPAGILAGLRVEGIDQPADLDPAISYLHAVKDAEFTAGITPTTPDAEVMDRLEQYVRTEISSVLKLLAALKDEIVLARDDTHSVAYLPNKPVKVDGRQERQNRVSVDYRKQMSIAADVPVLLLDASGNVEIYRRLFGDRLEVTDGALCERNVDVVQVCDATNALSTLTGTDQHGHPRSPTGADRPARLRGEMAAAASALAAKHGRSFMLATNMDVETALNDARARTGMSDAVLTGHFGKLRGRNDYEHCPAGMLLGRNQPPAWSMENIARAIWSDDPEPLLLPGAYVKETRGIRMRDGSAVPVAVDVHPDRRVQSVLELHRERESEQGADRLRMIHNSKRKALYICSNLPLDITVDRVVTQHQFIHETTGNVDNGRPGKGRRTYTNRLIEAFRRGGGVLPLSPWELCRLYPDLWPTGKKAVQNELAKMPLSAINNLIAERGTIAPSLQSYRVKGERGRFDALIATDIADAKAAIAALLGKQVVMDEPEPPTPGPGGKPP